MSATTLNARLKIRHDSATNWETNNPILLPGELAVATFADTNSENAPRAVLKVGDGEHNYIDLPVIEAGAADVYAWAKNATKPSYAAAEIAIADSAGNTDTTTVEAALAEIYTLIADLDGTSTITQNDIDTSIAAVAGTVPTGTTLQGEIATLIGNVSGDNAKSARTMAAEEVAKIVANADTSYDTLKEIADWILNDSTGAAKMANDITALNTAVTTLNANSLTTGSVDKKIADAIENIDIAVAANGQNETNKVLTAFEIANGALVANSVGTKTLATIATTGKAIDLTLDNGDYLILDGGVSNSYSAPVQS